MAALAALAACSLTVTAGAGAAPAKPTFVTSIGAANIGHAEIYPGGVTVDPAGNVYIADTGNDDVAAYDSTGHRLWTGGQRGSKALGNFDNPRDIAYLNGKLYIADLGNKRVQVMDAVTHQALSQWSTVFPSPIGISAGVDENGNPIILVSQDTKNQVTEYKPDGTATGRVFGSGTAGNGPGQLKAPRDAATDSAGNVYVADYGNDRIVKFGPTGGNALTQWGTSGGQDGQFRRPYGVDVDVNNRIYVADSTNHRVQIFNSSGGFIAKYGQAPPTQQSAPTDGQFAMLRRVAVQPGVSHPDIYLADLWGYRVSQVSQDASSPPNFTYVNTDGNKPPTDGAFNEPSGITFGAGHMYVADAVNQRMDAFDPSTYAYQFKWGERGWGADQLGFNWPRDIAYVAATNTLWVADTKNGRLVEFNPDGSPTGRTYGSLGSGTNQLNRPYAIEAAGSALIVADSTNNRVVRIDPANPMPSQPTWIATGISNPQDVAVDGTTVLVTDTRNNRLVRLSLSNGLQVGGLLGVGNLHSPEGVAVDANGDIWVGDRAYNRIVELDPSGAFLQTFGKLGTGPGQFDHPTHLAIQGDLLYVCDVWNDRVQVFDLAPAVGPILDQFSGSVSASGTVSKTFQITVTDTSFPIEANLGWTTTSANLNLFLMPPGSSTAVAQATSKTNNPETLSFQPTVPGTYTLRVKAITGSSTFNLTATHG